MDDIAERNSKRDLTEELLEHSFQSVRISSSTDGSLAQEIRKSFISRLAPWLREETKLLPHQEAAMLLEYASEGQELLKIELTQRSRICYHFRTQYHFIYRVAAWSILLIHIFELPTWTYRVSYENWTDGAIYPSYQLPYLPLLASSLLNLLCISVLWVAVLLEFGFKRNTRNWIYTVVFAGLLTVQTISVIMGFINAVIGNSIFISCAPLYAFNVLLIEHKYQNHLGYLLRTFPRFCVLLVFLGCMVVLYTSFAYYFFERGTTEFTEYFPDFGTGLWNMLMVMDGSNWPSPIIPAIHKNRLYCIYFFLYIILFNWGLLNLLLGFVYLFIRIEQSNISARYQIIKKLYLQTAFQVLDVELKGHLTYHQVDALIAEVYGFYTETMNPPSIEERYELVLELDSLGNGVINLRNFEEIEEKCFQDSLKALRAKKIRFHRFFSTATTSRKNTFLEPPTSNSRMQSTSFLHFPFSDHHSIATGSVAMTSSGPITTTDDQRESKAEDFENSSRIGDYYQSGHQDRVLSQASNYGKINNQQLVNRLRSVEIMNRLADNPSASSSKNCFDFCLNMFPMKLATLALYVDSKYFDIGMDTILAIFAISCFATDEESSWLLFVSYLIISSLECISKVFVKGRYRYFKSSRNLMDGTITVMLIGIVLGQISEHNKNSFGENFGLQSLVLIRLLSFPRNIIVLESFNNFRRRHRKAFVYAFQSAGHVFFLFLTMVAMLYTFAAFGLQIFGGSIVKTGSTGEKISVSEYGVSSYWPLNFNDMLSGLVTMFVLLHVNNMHVTTSGFVASTSRWAELFFILWYSFGVLLLLNVLIAVFVNQFAGYLEVLAIAEAQQQHQKLEREQEASENNSISNSSKVGEIPRIARSSKDSTASSKHVGELISGSARNSTVQRTPSYNYYSTVDELTNQPRASRGSKPRKSGQSSLEELHTGFDNSIFADKTYRASLVNMMKSETRNSVIKKDTTRPGSFSRTHISAKEAILAEFAQSKDIRGDRKAPKLSKTVSESDFRSSSFIDTRLSQSSEIRSSWRDQDSTTRDTWKANGRESLSEKAQVRRSATQQQVFNPIFISKEGSSKYGNIDADLEVTPEGEEEIVVNVELKLQNPADGTFDDANEESVMRAIETIENQIARKSVTFGGTSTSALPRSSAVGVKPVRMRTIKKKEATEDSHLTQSSASSQQFYDSFKAPSQTTAEPPPTPSPARTGSFIFILKGLIGILARDEEKLTRFEKAAVLIQFARDGEGEQLIHYSRFSFHCYKLRNLYAKVFKVAAALLVILRFFERPMWTYRTANDSEWHENGIYPRFGIPLISAQLMCALKFPILIVILIGLLLEMGYKELSLKNFFTTAFSASIPQAPPSLTSTSEINNNNGDETKTNNHDETITKISFSRIFRMMLCLHSIIMLLILLFEICSNFSTPEYVTATSFGTILYFLWFNRRTLQKARVIARILPKFSFVILLLALVVLIFASFGPMIFNLHQHSDDDYKNYSDNDDDSTIYFNTLPNSIWSVFVAITSSSFPNQVIPSYHSYREVSLYFIAFITIGAFGLLNLTIVLIFIEFQKSLQSAYDKQKISQDILLFKAFQILDVEGKGFLPYSEIQELCDEIYSNYSNFQKIGFSKSLTRYLLIEILDVDGDHKISLHDFLFFLDVMRIKLTLYKQYNLVEHHRRYLKQLQQQQQQQQQQHPLPDNLPPKSTPARKDHSTILSRSFHRVLAYLPFSWLVFIERHLIANRMLDVITDCLGLFFFLLNTFLNGIHSLYDPTNTSILLMILTLFFYGNEMCLKILFRGYSDYFRSFRNKFDFTTTIVLFLSIVIDASIQLLYENDFFTFTMKIAYLLRIFFFPRNIRVLFGHDQDIIKVAKLLRRIFSKLYTITMVFFCISYSYANIGCYLYGGLIDKHSANERFLHSEFVDNDFWPINFNDMLSSMSTLFICLHVSDFDVITTGFTSSTTNYSRIYFAIWYIIGVLFLLNVLKSFFLGEFLALFMNPLQNLPSLGYSKSSDEKNGEKKKVGQQRGNQATDKENDQAEITSYQRQMQENYWVSKQKLKNEGLRNRLVERLNQSLLASNRKGLVEDHQKTSNGNDDDHNFELEEGVDVENSDDEKEDESSVTPGHLSYREYRNGREGKLPTTASRPSITESNKTFDDGAKPRDEGSVHRSHSKSRGVSSAAILIAAAANGPSDVLIDNYYDTEKASQKLLPHSSSVFREIDESTANRSDTDFTDRTRDPHDEMELSDDLDPRNLSSSLEGKTVLVSSLKSKVTNTVIPSNYLLNRSLEMVC